MNREQELWWQQASSDHEVLTLLRKQGVAPCHQLHYLQMVGEKLGKAYFWRSGHPPPRRHISFVPFMRSLGAAPTSRRPVIAGAFGFNSFEGFQRWVRTALPLVYALERIAPNLAQDGPNPEYPWPHDAPADVPASFDFEVWRQLTDTGRGRKLLQIIQFAVERFPVYG